MRVNATTWGLTILLATTRSGISADANPKYYGYLFGGQQFVSSDDYKKQFDFTSFGYSRPDFPGNRVPIYGLGAGCFFTPRFGLELGFRVGPGRTFEATYLTPSGGAIYNERIDDEVTSYFAMPEVAFQTSGIFSKIGLHSIGLKLSPAYLYGSEVDTNYSLNATGQFLFESRTIGYGLQYRFVDVLAGGFGIGIETEFDVERFNDISIKNPTGAYEGSGPTQPRRNPDGSQAYVDVSGLSVRLVIGGWSFGQEVSSGPAGVALWESRVSEGKPLPAVVKPK